MKTFMAALVLGMAGLLAGCSDISYIGNTYAPTTDVKIYMNPASVPAGMYETMGKISASAAAGDGSLNEDIRKMAMQVGADAVVVLSTSRQKTGTTVTEVTNTTYSNDRHRHHADGQKRDTGTVTRQDIITDFVEAEFLRRKDRVNPSGNVQ